MVAPHPDDESLGCGGLIALASEAGRRVVVATLTDGEASHPGSATYPPKRLAAVRRSEMEQAARALGGAGVETRSFGAPDGRLERCEPEAQAWLAQLGDRAAFDVVFTTWAADPHPDHKAAFRVAARRAAAWGIELFAYPIWGLTLADDAEAGPVAPCLKLDISSVLDRKRTAVAAHKTQTTGEIADDPGGFRLSPADLARHLTPFEVFLRFGGSR